MEDQANLGLAVDAVCGGFESLLNRRLREERGYTYGVGSSISRFATNGMLTIGTSVESSVTAEALRETFDVLDTAVGQGITAKYHSDAVDSAVRRGPLNLQRVEGLLFQAIERWALGFPDDYEQRRLDAILASTPESISSALAAAWDPSRVVTVAVGDPEDLRTLSGVARGAEVPGDIPFDIDPEPTPTQGEPMSTIAYVEGREGFEEAINAGGNVLVDFTADWCSPCKGLAPILDSIAEERDDLTIVKVDADRNGELCQELNVSGLPTLILYEDGEQLLRMTGGMRKADLLKKLDPFL